MEVGPPVLVPAPFGRVTTWVLRLLVALATLIVAFASGAGNELPVGARYSIVAGQAACWYSLMRPVQRVDFTMRWWLGSG